MKIVIGYTGKNFYEIKKTADEISQGGDDLNLQLTTMGLDSNAYINYGYGLTQKHMDLINHKKLIIYIDAYDSDYTENYYYQTLDKIITDMFYLPPNLQYKDLEDLVDVFSQLKSENLKVNKEFCKVKIENKELLKKISKLEKNIIQLEGEINLLKADPSFEYYKVLKQHLLDLKYSKDINNLTINDKQSVEIFLQTAVNNMSNNLKELNLKKKELDDLRMDTQFFENTTNDTINQLNMQIKKLQNDKNEIETSSQNLVDLSQKITTLNKKIKSLENEKQNYLDDIDHHKETLKKKESDHLIEAESLKNAKKSLEQKLKEIEQKTNNDKKNYEKSILEKEKQIKDNEEIIAALQNNLINTGDIIKQLKEDINEYRRIEDEYQLSIKEQDSNNYNIEIKDLEDENDLFRNDIEELYSSLQDIYTQYSLLNNEILKITDPSSIIIPFQPAKAINLSQYSINDLIVSSQDRLDVLRNNLIITLGEAQKLDGIMFNLAIQQSANSTTQSKINSVLNTVNINLSKKLTVSKNVALNAIKKERDLVFSKFNYIISAL